MKGVWVFLICMGCSWFCAHAQEAPFLDDNKETFIELLSIVKDELTTAEDESWFLDSFFPQTSAFFTLTSVVTSIAIMAMNRKNKTLLFDYRDLYFLKKMHIMRLMYGSYVYNGPGQGSVSQRMYQDFDKLLKKLAQLNIKVGSVAPITAGALASPQITLATHMYFEFFHSQDPNKAIRMMADQSMDIMSRLTYLSTEDVASVRADFDAAIMDVNRLAGKQNLQMFSQSVAYTGGSTNEKLITDIAEKQFLVDTKIQVEEFNRSLLRRLEQRNISRAAVFASKILPSKVITMMADEDAMKFSLKSIRTSSLVLAAVACGVSYQMYREKQQREEATIFDIEEKAVQLEILIEALENDDIATAWDMLDEFPELAQEAARYKQQHMQIQKQYISQEIASLTQYDLH